jgi:hypothetical protein
MKKRTLNKLKKKRWWKYWKRKTFRKKIQKEPEGKINEIQKENEDEFRLKEIQQKTKEEINEISKENKDKFEQKKTSKQWEINQIQNANLENI